MIASEINYNRIGNYIRVVPLFSEFVVEYTQILIENSQRIFLLLIETRALTYWF